MAVEQTHSRIYSEFYSYSMSRFDNYHLLSYLQVKNVLKITSYDDCIANDHNIGSQYMSVRLISKKKGLNHSDWMINQMLNQILVGNF